MAGAVAQHGDDGGAHPGVLLERGFHLDRFDPHPADLHLVVEAAEEVQAAAGVHPYPVAGAVEAVDRGQRQVLRRRGEPACGEFGVEVPERQAVAADAQFALLPAGDGAAFVVRDDEGDARQRGADGRRGRVAGLRVGAAHGVGGGDDGGFCGAVGVVDGRGDVGGGAAAHAVAADDEVTQLQVLRPGPVQERFDGGSGRHGVGEGGVPPPLGEHVRVPAGVVRGRDEGGARGQGGPQFQQVRVERDTDEQGLAVARREAGLGPVPVEGDGERGLCHGDRLGAAGGTGGEDGVQGAFGRAPGATGGVGERRHRSGGGVDTAGGQRQQGVLPLRCSPGSTAGSPMRQATSRSSVTAWMRRSPGRGPSGR